MFLLKNTYFILLGLENGYFWSEILGKMGIFVYYVPPSYLNKYLYSQIMLFLLLFVGGWGWGEGVREWRKISKRRRRGQHDSLGTIDIGYFGT